MNIIVLRCAYVYVLFEDIICHTVDVSSDRHDSLVITGQQDRQDILFKGSKFELSYFDLLSLCFGLFLGVTLKLVGDSTSLVSVVVTPDGYYTVLDLQDLMSIVITVYLLT